MLARLGTETSEVRKPQQLDGLDGLVLPGGESTAIGKLVRAYDLEDAILAFPGAMFGTCAGMILLARDAVDGVPGQPLLGLIDISVRRNAYGRQISSFETDLEIAGESEPFRAVFIRAPWIERVGPEIEVLAELDSRPVLARSGRILVAAFHPELTGDTRVHELFCEVVLEARSVSA